LTGNYLVLNKIQTEGFIVYAATILSVVLILFTLFGTPVSFNYRKIDVAAYRRYFLANMFFCLLLVLILVLIVYIIEKRDINKLLIRILAINLAVFPFFNRNFVRGITQRLQQNKNFLALGISFGQLGKLAKIRNFVFTKDRIISSGIFQLTESEYRSTIKVTTAMHLTRQLAGIWNPKYTNLFVSDEFENLKLKYQVVEKNENGISVIDDDACMYHLGNSTFVKDKIKKDEHSNLFLLKNEILIAKFRINEKITAEKVELMNQLDYFGNTVLFNPGEIEDLGYDHTIIFDKIYSHVTESKQSELLRELEKKAPTAFFTAKNPKEISNTMSFHITTSIDAQSGPNKIVLSPQKLIKVPEMIRLAKKVHTLLSHTLLFSLFFQIVLFVIAIINYNSLIMLFGLNSAMAVIAEIVAILIIRKIGYLPSHPANLAQSHQAA
jgi:hypothetical protein